MGQTIISKRAAALCLTFSLAALAACTPPHPKPATGESLRTVSSLDCPDSQGDLKLQTKSADSCAYASGDGDQVTLKLVSVTGGDVKSALAPFEAQVKSELPNLATPATGAGADKDWKGGDHDNDDKDAKENVDLDLPGLHIHSHGDGHANVDTMGVHVTASDGDHQDGDAHVVVGGGGHAGVTVDAHDGGAQIRVTDPGSGIRQSYLLESDNPGPKGFHAAGYDARGPSDGPLVVATILAKEKGDDDLRHNVRALLKLNVGG